MKRVFWLLAAACTISGAVFARDTNNDGYETILVPIALTPGVEVPGNGGTRWRGEVWMHNGNPHPIELQAGFACIFNECQSVHPAGYLGTVTDPFYVTPSEGGHVLATRANGAENLTFSNRIFETSKNAQPLGVQVPIVREGSFLSGPSYFLGVPGGTDARVALRIYDPRLETRAAVTSVRVDLIEVVGPIGGPQQETVVESVTLTTAIAFRPGAARRPGYVALFDLANALPAIKTRDRFTLRLTPLVDNEYWAMVSVTDNSTQEFVIITPQ